MKKNFEGCFKAVMYLAFTFLVIFEVYLIFEDRPGQFTALTLCLIVLIAARIKDLVRFKFTKDGLEADLEKVRASIVEVQNIAELFGKVALQQMQTMGRWNGYSEQTKKQMRDDITEGLRRIEFSDERITEVLEVETPYFHFDYANRVMAAIGGRMTHISSGPKRDFINEQMTKVIGNELDPERMRAVMYEFDILDGDVLQAVEDYEYYHQNKKHRRPYVFGY